MNNANLKEEALNPDFKTRYCAHHKCQPKTFETRLFKQCLHRPGRIFGGLAEQFISQLFYSDFVFLRNAAMAKNYQELQMAINSYKLDCHRDPSFLHDTLKLRISCRKVIEVYTGLVKTNHLPPKQQDLSFDLMANTAG